MGPAQVQQFLTILKYMNLTKAANELYISQSALSQSLSKLEKEIGVRLFYRDNNRLILSQEGRQLNPFFEKFMKAYDDLVCEAKSLSQEGVTAMTIGYSGSALQFAALYMTDFFRKQNVEVALTYASRKMLESMLLNEQIDIAITYPPIVNDRISSIPISEETIVLAVPVNHPLAAKNYVTWGDLEGVQFLGSENKNHFRVLSDQLCERHGYKVNYHAELDYNDLYRAIAEEAYNGNYLSMTPEDCFEDTFGEGYRKVRFAEKGMSYVTALSWLTSRNTDLRYKELFSYITDAYAEQERFHSKYTGFLAKSFREYDEF